MTRRVRHTNGNLPADVTSLIGRRTEAAELRQLLAKSRMVTLTGPGGVGKTRLALQVARGSSGSFVDGVWFVPLADVTRPDLVVPTIMSILDLGGMGRGLAQQIGRKRMLLVLDNCEHLTAACAGIATSLLAACPELTVLATSRESLRIAGETNFAVRPLSVPKLLKPGETLGATGSRDAVDLFVARAQLANPDLTMDAQTERSVVELCRRLDGLPLAIELTAAAACVLPIAALNAQAALPLTPPVRGLRSAPSRHQSLRATIACSYDLCSPLARIVWQRMSVLRGGTSLEIAQRVCSDESLSRGDVLHALVELTDKSVLEFDGSLYRMLEAIRQFGAEGLASSGDEPAMRAAHLSCIVGLAREAEQRWNTGDQGQVVQSIRKQWANVRAALDLCLTEPVYAQTGLQIARQLFGFWVTSVPMREGRSWLNFFLRVIVTPSEDRASALWIAGLLTTLDGDVESAEELIQEGIALSRELGDPANLAHALQGLGFCHVLRNNLDDSLTVLNEAVSLERSLAAPNPHLGRALTTQGIALCAAGQAVRAATALKEARSVQRATGDDFMGSWSDVFLGLAACLNGQSGDAEAILREALERKKNLGDTLGVSLALEFLGWTALNVGDHDRGARLLGASEAVSESVAPHLVGFTRLLQWHEEYRAFARTALGSGCFESAIQSAREMSISSIVTSAIGGMQEPAPRVEELHELPLTPRERQIALLIAEGKTNRQIASELVIAHRTVDSHVENILVKLDFSSRAQIAALVARG